MKQGVMLDELRLQVENGEQYDDFDLIAHVAYDKPALTRSERARKVKQSDVYTQYEATARQVIDALLERYAADGIEVLEQAADSKQAQQVLRLKPFNAMGTPQQIARAFGGRKGYITAIKQVRQQIYTV